MSKKLTLKELLAAKNTKTLIAKLSFEEALQLSEELVEQVESGSLPLEQSITSYETGVQLIEHLRALLSGAEEKLRVLEKGAGKKK